MSDRLEIRLLGPFEVIAGGRRVDIPGSKRQALLAMLALASGRVVAVDDLIDALWGAELPAAPRNAVQHHVARLRAALGHDAVAGSGDGYALQPRDRRRGRLRGTAGRGRRRRAATATHMRQPRMLRRRSRCGAARRFRASPMHPGSAQKRVAWTACGWTRWKSGSTRRWRWGSTAR